MKADVVHPSGHLTHQHMISIHRAKNGQFFVRFTARNGAIVMNSETYKVKRSARTAVKSVARMFRAAVTEQGIRYKDLTGPVLVIRYA